MAATGKNQKPTPSRIALTQINAPLHRPAYQIQPGRRTFAGTLPEWRRPQNSRMPDLSLRTATPPSTTARSNVDKRRTVMAFSTLLTGVILFGSFAPVQAECMRDWKGRVICDRGQCVSDLHGVVYCSRYEDGAALKTLYGEVVCSKGECVTTLKGDIICSARPGGAAMKDLYGKVTCEGGCERASLSLCGQNSGALQ